LALARILIKIAAVSAPRSLPKNSQFLRPIAHGRNVRSDELFSLTATCRSLTIDPFVYLRDVLDRVATHPARRIEALLPDRWGRLRDLGPGAPSPPQ
jgi:hypothetical protein